MEKEWKDIKHKSATFFITGGRLKRRCKPFPQVVITDTQFQKKIMQNLHEELGHRGMNETYRRIKLRLWWPNMRRIVKQWDKSCLPCQQRSSAKHMELKQSTGAQTIFGRISIDTVHIKAGKWKYLVLARDELSGWVEAVGMENLKATKVADWFLEHWIHRYGAPQTVVVDGGSEFGQDLQQALHKAGTKSQSHHTILPRSKWHD